VVKLLSSRIRAVTTSSRSLISAMPTIRRSHSTGRVLTKSSTLSLLRTSPPGRILHLVGPGDSLAAAVEPMWTFPSISRCDFTTAPAAPRTHLVRRALGHGTSMCKLSALTVTSCCRRRTSPTRGILSAFLSPRILTVMVALLRSLWVR
jgi:hypothetical protein